MIKYQKSKLFIFLLDEYDQGSVLVRTCEANVAVNKCEGACASSIQPSALTTHGFQKVGSTPKKVLIFEVLNTVEAA